MKVPERNKTLIFKSKYLFCLQSSPNKTSKKHQTSQYRDKQNAAENHHHCYCTSTTGLWYRWGTTTPISKPDVPPHSVPLLCGTPTLPSCRLQPGERWEGCFGLVPISSAFIRYRITCKGQMTNNHQSGNNFMWKTLHFQSPLVSNHE